jgi:hypothetical protein
VTVEQRRDVIPGNSPSVKTSPPPLKEIPVVTPVATPVISAPKKGLDSNNFVLMMVANLNEVAAAAEPLAPNLLTIPSQDCKSII